MKAPVCDIKFSTLTSVTAGTVMYRTRTPLRTWFWAAYLVATHRPGSRLQRQLGLSRYETARLILQKLRRAMVAPQREPLKGEVEIDDFWLGGHETASRAAASAARRRSPPASDPTTSSPSSVRR